MQFVPATLGAQLSNRTRLISHLYCADPAMATHTQSVIRNMHKRQKPAPAVQAILEMQRLYVLHLMDIANDQRIIDAYHDKPFPAWQDFVEVEMSDAEKENVATSLYEGVPNDDKAVLLEISDYSRGISERIITRAVQDKQEMDVWINDPVFEFFILSLNEEALARHYGEVRALPREHAGRRITFNLNTPSFQLPEIPDAIKNIHSAAYKDRINARSRDLVFTNTRIPTRENARHDGVSHTEALKNYALMCSYKSNDPVQKTLEQKMNATDIVHIRNNEGTNLYVRVNGFDVIDSRTRRNVPGDEVFTAVERNFTHGMLRSKRKYLMPHTSHLVEDIKLFFENGCVVDFDARTGKDVLEDFFAMDNNHRYLCEFAVNTNMAYTGWTTNSLLVEKAGGKLHVALGNTYKDRHENGRIYHLDNGNKARFHVDLAIPMHDTQGCLRFDDEYIMENGIYIIPELKELNPA